MSDKAKKRLVAEQEADFLLAYYGKSSPTRLDRRASAITAGYTARMALWNANRLLAKFADKGFRECVEAIGVSTPALAVAFRETLEKAEGKEALASLRLALANRGEMTDGAGAQKPTVNVNLPVLVIRGASEERMQATFVQPNRKALIRGGAPQLAETQDHAPELPPAPEATVDVEAAPVEAPPPAPAKPERDARGLPVSDFTGRNLSEKPKGPSY
jgi:hypothetical protein